MTTHWTTESEELAARRTEAHRARLRQLNRERAPEVGVFIVVTLLGMAVWGGVFWAIWRAWGGAK